ncbi:MAG TPA: FtsX-like permease family protein [Mucilaginibacter sp.]|jgi:putative ABC transport system permease protein|nr:FtsX-like permease family protein [Mucilaginibacter sp.]
MDNIPVNYKRRLNIPWLFEMAWRDSRRNRSRLFLFISSIIFGIAALVAIYSFGFNLKKDVDNQAATLIGSDLSIYSNKPVDASMKPLIDSLGDRRSQEKSFASMILFPKSGGTRLVQVRALQGEFPYYGSLETTPVNAGINFKKGKRALVDQTLMLQFNVKVNDSIKVGNVTFLIAGALNKAPGQTNISSGIAPIVYIPMQYLDKTGLLEKGSRINYNFYYKYDHKVDMTKLAKSLDPRLDKAGMNYDTIDTKKESTGRAFGDLTKFLSLVGFIALLLGCVGVASAIHIYVREKIASIAIMRCLGVKAYEAFLIYLIQIACIGLIGSVIGAVLGSFVQHLMPYVFKDFLPISISTDISWMAIAQGILLGVIISILFALLPLIAIRNISPLNTLRISYENLNLLRDPLRWLVYLLIVLFIMTFTYLQLDSWIASVFFTIGIFIAFLILTLIAKLLMYLVRIFIKSTWSYLWRQGFANLYRPNNQTIILIVSIGLSTAFICTLFFIQSMLVKQVAISASTNQANMILFDIQNSQEKGVAALARQRHLPVLQQVPVVTIRLEKVNGKTEADIKKDTTLHISSHVFANEYRVTYRDTLTPTEKVTDGDWAGHASKNSEAPISVEERWAKHNHLKVGDHLTFNVQGMQVATKIASIRVVNWNKMQTNFLVVFPKGVIDDAPQFHVLLTHVPSKAASASFQQAVVKKFPNVSMIDLGFVLSVLDDLMNKLGDIIRFMAMFSIITGVVVLIASVRISKYQRIQESVLLRTMGASRKQILAITAIEYFFLGALSAATGILIAFVGSWLLAKYSFDIPFNASMLPALLLFLAIAILTILIGLFNSRGILNKPPLEILRRDV